MNTRKLSLAALAALTALAVALCGCAYNPESVMTVDGESVPAGRWLYYQMSALSAAENEISDAGDPDGVLSKATADVLAYELDGVSVRDRVRADAIESCERYLFIEREFERLGLAFEADELEYDKSNVKMTWDYYAKDYYEQNGVGYDSFLAVYLNRLKEGKIRTALYSEDGEQAISAADKQAYFESGFAQCEYFKLPSQTAMGTSLIDTYGDEARDLALRMVTAAQSGGLKRAYLDLYGEALEMAMDTTTAVDDASAESAVTSMTVSVSLGYSAELVDAVLAAQIGAYGSAEADDTIYIFRRVALPDDVNEAAYDSTIITAMSEEPFDALVKEAVSAYEVAPDERALSYYSADKVSLA